MKKILFVAPSSYPINGPESMVNAKHIYMLCKMGYHVDLVCRGINKRHISYPSDKGQSLFSLIKSINIVSVDTKIDLKTLFRHFKTLIKTGYVYKGADWAYPAISECERLEKKNQYDYIFTKDYPSEIVGLYISKKYGCRWIPTWNDPYMMKKYPQPYGLGPYYKEGVMRKRLIKAISTKPYKHLFPSDRLCNYMLQYMYGMKQSDCVIMPHILVDGDIENNNMVNKDIGLNIIHTGSVGRERNPETFLRSLSIVVKKHPDWELKTTFLGIIDRARGSLLYDLVDKYMLSDIVTIAPPIPYNECLNFVKQFDICLLIEAACPEGIFLPSKIVDYLQNNKKIFALSPKVGVINDYFKLGIVDYFADVLEEDEIVKAIEQAYYDKQRGQKPKTKDLGVFTEKHIYSIHNSILI